MTRTLSKVFLYAWNEHSAGAKALAIELGIKRIKHTGSKFRQRPWKTIINWGSRTAPGGVIISNFINCPNAVLDAQDKLKTFNRFKQAPNPPRVPEWTTDKEVAKKWITEKTKVAVRNVLNGHSGNGLSIISEGELPSAPLYVKYIPKASEYRVHIVRGEVIDVQRKIRDPDREPSDWQIRSHNNGFIFVRGGFVTPGDVLTQAGLAFTASGLDFGAVDVVWNDKSQKAYVLEINTAPGLEGTTVLKYADAFRKFINNN